MTTDAELLLDIADVILYPRQELIVAEGLPSSTADTFILALRLKSRPDIVLRAVMEEWTRFQIVRELY